MKRPIEPGWALFFGFLIAPIASTLNARLFRFLAGELQWNPRFFVELLQSCFSAAILSVPLGFMTARMMEIWARCDHLKARTLGISFGLFSLAFWGWLLQSLQSQRSLSPETLVALALPFAWSLLLPIFALLMRAPKP